MQSKLFNGSKLWTQKLVTIPNWQQLWKWITKYALLGVTSISLLRMWPKKESVDDYEDQRSHGPPFHWFPKSESSREVKRCTYRWERSLFLRYCMLDGAARVVSSANKIVLWDIPEHARSNSNSIEFIQRLASGLLLSSRKQRCSSILPSVRPVSLSRKYSDYLGWVFWGLCAFYSDIPVKSIKTIWVICRACYTYNELLSV